MFENLIAKLAGNWIAKKTNLQEGPMDSKPWYKSKGIWTGIVAGLVGGYNGLAPSFQWPPIPDFVFVLFGAMGVYTRATADKAITLGSNPQ